MVIYLEKLEKVKDTQFKSKITLNLIDEWRSALFNIKSCIEILYEYHFQRRDHQDLEFEEIELNRLVRIMLIFLS